MANEEKHIEVVGQSLNKAEKKLLAEALRQGEHTRATVEEAVREFGDWVLINVFDNDAGAALHDRRANPVWLEILARAGGPTLKLNRKLVYVSVRIAALDRRIADERWRTLDAGRKEILLPLADEKLLRDAAHRVVAMSMSQTATRGLVTQMLEGGGVSRGTRITPQRAIKRLLILRSRASEAALESALKKASRDGSPEVRKELRANLDALKTWAAHWLTELGKH